VIDCARANHAVRFLELGDVELCHAQERIGDPLRANRIHVADHLVESSVRDYAKREGGLGLCVLQDT
jgi:hypothetical protein